MTPTNPLLLQSVAKDAIQQPTIAKTVGLSRSKQSRQLQLFCFFTLSVVLQKPRASSWLPSASVLLRLLISQRRPLATIAPLSHYWQIVVLGDSKRNQTTTTTITAPATTCLTPLGYSARLTDWIRSHIINRTCLHLPVRSNNTA